MFKVPDARKIAKALTDAGFTGVGKPTEMPQYQTVVIMVRDPDGNQIEMLQVGPAK
jgi:predicted enzyme related to lactoylglutathione lyase